MRHWGADEGTPRMPLRLLGGQRGGTVGGGGDGDDAALTVEGQAVDADLAVDAWLMVNEVLVDAVVDNVPLVLAGQLQDGVVGRAVDLVLGLLLDDHVVLLVEGDGAEGLLRRAVAHVVVGRASVVDAP